MDVDKILEERQKLVDASNKASRAIVAFCATQIQVYEDYKIDIPPEMKAAIKVDFVAARAEINAALSAIVAAAQD